MKDRDSHLRVSSQEQREMRRNFASLKLIGRTRDCEDAMLRRALCRRPQGRSHTSAFSHAHAHHLSQEWRGYYRTKLRPAEFTQAGRDSFGRIQD